MKCNTECNSEHNLTSAVGDQMEDRGAADGFAVGRGAPAVSGLVVALRWQEVAVWMALWHKDGSSWTHVAPTLLGLLGLALRQLAFGQTWI